MFLQRLFQARSRRSVSWLVLTSQVVSLLFSPFYLPVIAFAALLVFSYLNMLPLLTKVLLLVLVYCFTIALPHFFIFLYRQFNGDILNLCFCGGIRRGCCRYRCLIGDGQISIAAGKRILLTIRRLQRLFQSLCSSFLEFNLPFLVGKPFWPGHVYDSLCPHGHAQYDHAQHQNQCQQP